jgi:hypothetical protein
MSTSMGLMGLMTSAAGIVALEQCLGPSPIALSVPIALSPIASNNGMGDAKATNKIKRG